MTGDQGEAVHPGLQVGPKTEPPGDLDQRRRGALTGQVLELHQRLVGPLADSLHIELEEEIPHGGVAGYGNLVDLLTGEVQ